jgi:hypothetical protein
LTATSVRTKNKKLGQVLENRDFFVKAFEDLSAEIGDSERSFQESNDEALVNTIIKIPKIQSIMKPHMFITKRVNKYHHHDRNYIMF